MNIQTEITPQNVFDIETKTVSPLIQLTTNGDLRKEYAYDENENLSYQLPFFSGNGLRGLLRRVATHDMVKIINESNPDFKIKAKELHLFTAGGGADKKSQENIKNINHNNVNFIREQMPILSLFGAGLSDISGKIAVSDLRPPQSAQNPYSTHESKDGKITTFSNYISKQTFVRKDETTSADSLLTELVDAEDVAQWQEESQKINAKNKSAKTNAEASGEKAGKQDESSMAQLFEYEYIKPNTTLTSSLNPINFNNLLPHEIGLLIKTLLNLSKMQIGSAKRLGYGFLNWEIRLNQKLMFKTIRNPDYIANIDDEKSLVTEQAKEYIKIYEDHAKIIYSPENILLENVAKKAS